MGYRPVACLHCIRGVELVITPAQLQLSIRVGLKANTLDYLAMLPSSAAIVFICPTGDDMYDSWEPKRKQDLKEQALKKLKVPWAWSSPANRHSGLNSFGMVWNHSDTILCTRSKQSETLQYGISSRACMKTIAWACLKMHDKSVLSALHIIVFHKKVFFVCFTFSLFIYMYFPPIKRGSVLMIVATWMISRLFPDLYQKVWKKYMWKYLMR